MHADTTPVDEREELLDRAVVDYLRAEAAGYPPDRQEFLKQHPGLGADLSVFFAARDEVTRLAAPLRQAVGAAALPSSFGTFEMLEEIGRGGMGVVYRARDRSLNRTVAVKRIAPGACAGPAALARFRNEARAAARLLHPNVVQIFEVGGNLAQQLRGQPLPAEQAAWLVETLAHAVHAAHQCGIIHRDLKPANVLLKKMQPRITRITRIRKSHREVVPLLSYPCYPCYLWLIVFRRSLTSVSPSRPTPRPPRTPKAAPFWARPATWPPSKPKADRRPPPPTFTPWERCSTNFSPADRPFLASPAWTHCNRSSMPSRCRRDG